MIKPKDYLGSERRKFKNIRLFDDKLRIDYLRNNCNNLRQ